LLYKSADVESVIRRKPVKFKLESVGPTGAQ
jgi:hypothetical protein